jgi:predicted O-linked N-acetylglucosamine transferase (SPINDLY family)
VPESRLLIVCPEGQAGERIHALFATHGIARERLELVAPAPWPEYIRLFERIDVALDSFPCNGMTTTCHALWMGVPVVSMAGRPPVSRAGCSQLSNLELPELLAVSEDEYVAIATRLGHDLPRLTELRRTLRPRMESSPLMDAPRFARHVETAFRTMWQHWCAEQPA